MNKSPHLWTRRAKILEPNRELILPARIAGFWKLRVLRPDGRCRIETPWFPNLITDVGLDKPGAGADWVSSCVVGTDNGAPANSDTALGAEIASSSNRTNITAASNQTADRYVYARTTFRFAAGDAEGNLAEIGIKTGTTPILFSRALILDGGGSPTTLTILSDEVLDATYEIRTYPPLTDLETTMVVSGVTYDVVVRAAEVDQWGMVGGGFGQPVGWAAGSTSKGAALYPSTSTLGTVLTSPSGAASGNSSGATSAYTPGSYFRDFSYTWNLSAAPSGGAAAMDMWVGNTSSGGGEAVGLLKYQMSFDPVLPKTGSNNLTLNFRHPWSRRSL